MAGALCYLATIITGILFLVIAPYNQNKFIRFHAFQAIFFWVAAMALWIFEFIITFMLPLLAMFLGLIMWVGFLACWLLLMYKAYNNEKFKLPIIGDLAEKQA